MPYKYPFPVDPILTSITLAYKNARYIADFVLPRVKVPAESFKYRVFDKETYLTVPDTSIGRKGMANEVELLFSERPANTVDHGLDMVISLKDIDAAKLQGYDPQQKAVEFLTELLTLAREQRVAQLVFNAAVYTSQVKQLENAEKFDNDASDPIDTIIQAMDVPFFRPNTVVMGREVFSALSRHPKVLRTVYPNADGNGIINAQQLTTILNVDRVLVGEARLNLAKRGGTNIQSVWGNNVALLYIDPKAGVQDVPTFGFTAEYGNREGRVISDPNVGRKGANRVKVSESINELIAAPDLGYLLQNVIA
ncbi:MAG: hypothetical protein II870_08260 [Synergistaceae bacterium]|nr:hypothetical protein [Synergistaceae bacterium]MBQ6910173.1 hypothetical protein [Synergistaceae bacterium]